MKATTREQKNNLRRIKVYRKFIQRALTVLGKRDLTIKINLTITKNRYSFCRINKNNEVKFLSISTIKKNYSDDYYKGRAERINPLFKNNFTRYTRFVLAHELQHAIDLKEKGYTFFNSKNEEIFERKADDTGIKLINLKI